MKKSFNAALFFSAAFFLVLPLFSSCKNNAKTEKSFVNMLDMVDALVATGETSEAMSVLKKAEKSAYSSFARLSVYKRYVTLGDEKKAENVLVTGLKKIPGNPEISCVYAQYLLRTGKIEEALKISEVLKDTKYATVYSEAFFKSKRKAFDAQKNPQVYLEDDMNEVYDMAFKGTGDERWLVNAALSELVKGNYQKAAAKYSYAAKTEDGESVKARPYFWGLVNFDSGNYATAMNLFQNVKEPIRIEFANYLVADCYQLLGDEDASQERRNEIFERKQVNDAASKNLYMNSALWAKEKGEKRFEYEMLSLLVNKFPDYVPGLSAYGDYSVESNSPKFKSDLEKELRMKALSRESKLLFTKQMSEFDDIPRVPVEDALFRMNEILETQKEIERAVDYNLVIAEKNLRHKVYFLNNNTAKFGDLWRTLEQYQLGKNLYPSKVAHWVIRKFLETLDENYIKEAKKIFLSYMDSKYISKTAQAEEELQKDLRAQALLNGESDVDVDIFGGEKPKKREPSLFEKMSFYEKIASAVDEVDLWEAETAAYYAIKDKDINSGLRLLEYVVNESPMKYKASVSSKMNLAMILSSIGEKKRALSIYGDAMGITRDRQTKAEILYRMAKVQLDLKDERNGILSLEYCISLDPGHASARLLLGKIK